MDAVLVRVPKYLAVRVFSQRLFVLWNELQFESELKECKDKVASVIGYRKATETSRCHSGCGLRSAKKGSTTSLEISTCSNAKTCVDVTDTLFLRQEIAEATLTHINSSNSKLDLHNVKVSRAQCGQPHGYGQSTTLPVSPSHTDLSSHHSRKASSLNSDPGPPSSKSSISLKHRCLLRELHSTCNDRTCNIHGNIVEFDSVVVIKDTKCPKNPQGDTDSTSCSQNRPCKPYDQAVHEQSRRSVLARESNSKLKNISNDPLTERSGNAKVPDLSSLDDKVQAHTKRGQCLELLDVEYHVQHLPSTCGWDPPTTHRINFPSEYPTLRPSCEKSRKTRIRHLVKKEGHLLPIIVRYITHDCKQPDATVPGHPDIKYVDLVAEENCRVGPTAHAQMLTTPTTYTDHLNTIVQVGFSGKRVPDLLNCRPWEYTGYQVKLTGVSRRQVYEFGLGVFRVDLLQSPTAISVPPPPPPPPHPPGFSHLAPKLVPMLEMTLCRERTRLVGDENSHFRQMQHILPNIPEGFEAREECVNSRRGLRLPRDLYRERWFRTFMRIKPAPGDPVQASVPLSYKEPQEIPQTKVSTALESNCDLSGSAFAKALDGPAGALEKFKPNCNVIKQGIESRGKEPAQQEDRMSHAKVRPGAVTLGDLKPNPEDKLIWCKNELKAKRHVRRMLQVL